MTDRRAAAAAAADCMAAFDLGDHPELL